MSDLSPKLQGLVEASRAVEGPTAEDQKRVRHGLAVRLVGAAAAGAATTAVAKSMATAAEAGAHAATAATAAQTSAPLLAGLGKYVIASLVVAGTAGTATMVALNTSEPTEQATAPALVADHQSSAKRVTPKPRPKPTKAEPETAADQPEEQPAEEAKKTSPSKSAAPAKPGPGSLERELSLVRSAQRALDSGQPAQALAILRRYSTEFPRGVLREESHAVRIMALCASGNRATARKSAERFIKARPGSPLSKRIRTACGTIRPKD